MSKQILAIGLAAVLAWGTAADSDPRPLPEQAGKPVVAWAGAHSKIAERRFERVRTQEAWEALWHRHTGEGRRFVDAEYAYAPRIDFDRCEVIAFFRGPATNTDGEEAVSVEDVGAARRVRFDSITFQTASFDGPDRGVPTEPFGIWVLDRTDRAIVVEENVQGLIGQPPVWKEQHRFDPPR